MQQPDTTLPEQHARQVWRPPSDDRPTLLVVGASGYLGGYLAASPDPTWRLVGTHLSRPPRPGLESYRLDLRNAGAIQALLERVRPSAVLHAAYRPDDPSLTVKGTRNLVAACAEVGARLVFVSTDLVFDGERGWYRETDPTAPLADYGASKVLAEQEVLAHGGVVARTSLIYGFSPLDSITRRLVVEPLTGGPPSTLFVDEYRCPAYAPDLAAALLELAASSATSLLHLTGPQRLSRYEFGKKLAAALGLDPTGLAAGSRAAAGVARPGDCSLDTSLARRILRRAIRSVDEVLQQERELAARALLT